MTPQRLRRLRESLRDDPAAAIAAFRPEIDNPIRGLNQLQIVLNQQNTSPVVDEPFERFQQLGDVIVMQPGGGFVEEKQRALAGRLRQMRGKFNPLSLAARKGRCGLAEPQITQPNVIQYLQARGQA